MLKSLTLNDFALSASMLFEPAAGFNALTGETGAGKSLLLDGLAFVLGSKARSAWVRDGAAQAVVSAVFEPDPATRERLNELELGLEGAEEISLRRSMDASGRSRCFINSRAVSLSELASIGSELCALFSQRESQRLLSKSGQSMAIDELLGLEAPRLGVEKAWEALRARERELEEFERQGATARERRERLVWELDALGELAPGELEWERLCADQERLASEQERSEQSLRALELLDDPEAGASRALGKAVRLIDAARQADPELEACAVDAVRALEELSFKLSRGARSEESSQAQLSKIEARMGAFSAIARKLRQDPQDLARRFISAQAQIEALEQANSDSLKAARDHAHAQHASLCAQLGARRRSGARELAAHALPRLHALGMPKAKLSIEFEAVPPGPTGAERPRLLFCASSASPLQELEKAASGGELSRACLALILSSPARSAQACLVFDEIDAGVGGETALSIGQLMREVGGRAQALAVTHLPQVACYAHAQHRVSKEEAGSSVERLAGVEREREIARMLGAGSLQSAMTHAQSLLSQASASDAESVRPTEPRKTAGVKPGKSTRPKEKKS